MVDAAVSYQSIFLPQQQADACFICLQTELQWRQDSIKVFGKRVKIPRLQAWYGDANAHYQYSGKALTPLPWTATLRDLKAQCEAVCHTRFNSVLANWYRDGEDAMGWHSDNEVELGQEPVIASLSLGVARDFDFRHRHSGEKYRLQLTHGSLLVMAGPTQQHWQHSLPRRKRIAEGRINLTFRRVLTGTRNQ